MRNGARGVAETGTGLARVVGRHGGVETGPVLVALGGMHGNEPAGLEAARRVLARLERESPRFRGEAVVLAGNLRALDAGVRFVDRDLNRAFTPERIRGVDRAADLPRDAEDLEQRDLLDALEDVLRRARGEAYFIDLHTSSAPGCPFATIGDTLRNRSFARHFPLPLILGLEEQIDGALLEYLNNRGLVTLGIEAGQHAARASVDHLEAALWIAMVATGQIEAGDVANLSAQCERLRSASAGVPAVIEVRSRHPIRPGDEFRMEPGYTNFQRVAKGQLLARHGDREVRAAEGGRILLPLYQGLGDDGFFLAREVRPQWLAVSAALRRLGLARQAHRLPGVRRDPADDSTLRIDTRVARWFPLEVLHLLGFRKLRREGSTLVVSRRAHDLAPPSSYV